MNVVLLGLLVLALGVVIDGLYVIWAKASTSGRALLAAVTSAGIQLFGLLAIYLAINDLVLLIPSILGHGLGSYLTVKYHENARQSG